MAIRLCLACLAVLSGLPALGATLRTGPHALEDLGPATLSGRLHHRLYYRDPATAQYHLVISYTLTEPFYREQPYQLLDLNLATGEHHLLNGTVGVPGPSGILLHSNGKLYVGTGDPGRLWEWDRATGATRELGVVTGGKGTQSVEEGDDGAVYVGSYSQGKLLRFDPRTDEWTDYGILDNPGGQLYRFVYTIAADDRYVYAALGQQPWYIVVVDRQTGAQKTLWKDLDNGFVGIFRNAEGGWFAQRNDRRQQPTYFDLRGGEAIPRADRPQLAPRGGMVELPHPERDFPYEVNLDDGDPDSGSQGHSTIRWRSKGAEEYRTVVVTVNMCPAETKRLYRTPDGKLLGLSAGYGPVFEFDPSTAGTRLLGRPATSTYDALRLGEVWYIAGYPDRTIRWDPAQPWTLNPSLLATDARSNPHRLNLPSAKYHYRLAAGADGMLWIG